MTIIDRFHYIYISNFCFEVKCNCNALIYHFWKVTTINTATYFSDYQLSPDGVKLIIKLCLHIYDLQYVLANNWQLLLATWESLNYIYLPIQESNTASCNSVQATSKLIADIPIGWVCIDTISLVKLKYLSISCWAKHVKNQPYQNIISRSLANPSDLSIFFRQISTSLDLSKFPCAQ